MRFVRPWCVRLVLAAAILLAARSDSFAQAYISPLIGFDFGGDSGCPQITDCEDKKLNAGVSLGSLGTVFGFEEEFAYAKNFFGDAPGLSSSVLTLMTNILLVPAVGPIRPYAVIGAGLIKSHVELAPASVLTSDNNNFGWDLGGGVFVLLGAHVGVRGDIRYFHSFQDVTLLDLAGEKLDFGRGSAALVLQF